jgi:hypothetical protein
MWSGKWIDGQMGGSKSCFMECLHKSKGFKLE